MFFTQKIWEKSNITYIVRRGGSTTNLQFDGFNMQLSQVFRGTWRSDVRHLPFACLIFAKPDFSCFNIYIQNIVVCIYVYKHTFTYMYIYNYFYICIIYDIYLFHIIYTFFYR